MSAKGEEKRKKSSNSVFFENAYHDIYALGDVYRTVFGGIGKRIGRAFYTFFRFIFVHIISGCKAFGRTVKRYFLSVVSEGRQFFSGVKRAMPQIKEAFKKKPARGVSVFFKYMGHAFKVYEKFNRAVLSTLIPAAAVIVLFLTARAMGGLTFAVTVYVNDTDVGTVANETAYKEAEQEAEKRFEAMGSDIDIALPVYKIALTTTNALDDKMTVCNNIIGAVSESTVTACGVYVNDEFLCAVNSEDTFNRVKTAVLSEYAEENGYTSDDCTVDFYDTVTVETGLYPDNDTIWTSDELYAYMSGYSVERREYQTEEDDTLETILLKTGISEDRLSELNENLDADNIPEGSVLLIDEGQRNMSIRVTVTYIASESIPYSTVSQYDSSIYVGSTLTIVEGSAGQDVVTYTDTYVDGVLTDSKAEKVRYNVKAAVNELIRIGTKGVSDSQTGVSVSPRLLRDQGGTFLWPAPDNCFWLSQGYNPSNSHYGIDICSSNGSSCRGRRIVSVADGVVVLATYHYSWGYYIRVDHGDGVVTGYAHALEGSFLVNVGDYVTAGQQLSSIGTTGNSTGYHLHFEVWLDGTRVNPLPYVYSEYTGISVQ
ncbi:MAG: peptidoglycan DD-metalloendopeptidase family protein [Clostridiales bacterium]|nr:peptidoglycan DD-metalloendopeptidase family protein [Clostridiales bacterium]